MDRSVLQQRVGKTLRHAVLILWSVTTIFPLLWTFMSAFKDNSQIFISPFALPDPAILENFPKVFRSLDITGGLMNSLIYSFSVVLVVALLSTMVGFYLSKCTKGRALYLYFIMGMMLPMQAIVIPLFIRIRDLGLTSSRIGIILVYVVTNLAFSVFIMTGFVRRSVPDEIIEASIIDGCSGAGIFFRVVLPLAKSGIATVGTFVFLNVWNEFFYALIFLPSAKLSTLNLITFKLRGQYSSDYGPIAAGVIIVVVPALIIYALFQEQVVKGLTAGAIKG